MVPYRQSFPTKNSETSVELEKIIFKTVDGRVSADPYLDSQQQISPSFFCF